MDNLQIQGDKKQPEVLMDAENGIIRIAGRSILENPLLFYTQIDTWFDEYIDNPQEHTQVQLQFEYTNSGTSKWLISFARKLKNLHDEGYDVSIEWFFDDEDLHEFGKKLKDIVEIPVKLTEVHDNEKTE